MGEREYAFFSLFPRNQILLEEPLVHPDHCAGVYVPRSGQTPETVCFNFDQLQEKLQGVFVCLFMAGLKWTERGKKNLC